MSLTTSIISDRRVHDRHAIRTQATLLLRDGRVLAGYTIDIGEGGAAVVCDLNIPLDYPLTIQLALPANPKGSAPFKTEAVVANCILASRDGGFRIGLSFRQLEPSAKAALKGLNL
jgi:hypothetical protein